MTHGEIIFGIAGIILGGILGGIIGYHVDHRLMKVQNRHEKIKELYENLKPQIKLYNLTLRGFFEMHVHAMYNHLTGQREYVNKTDQETLLEKFHNLMSTSGSIKSSINDFGHLIDIDDFDLSTLESVEMNCWILGINFIRIYENPTPSVEDELQTLIKRYQITSQDIDKVAKDLNTILDKIDEVNRGIY